MEAKILKKERNPLLQREECVIEIISDSNPGESPIKEFVGKDKDLTIIRTISNNFGKSTFLADVVVYDSIEAKNEIMTIPKKIRKKLEEERKKAEEEAKKKEEEEAKVAQAKETNKEEKIE